MLPLAVALFYAFALFLFASWAEGDSHPVLKQRLRPPAYALALAVYCTSWTYYGAVGSAVADGWSYLPIYLGPVLVFVVAHPFLRRLIDAVKTDGANSISEFIGGRFGNSQGVAALVTILALLGSIPYLALQLRSLGTTYALIAGTQAGPLTIGFAAALLALFAMIYGTRRYEAGSRNDAILFAVSFESVLKLGALLVAGFIAVLLLAKAPEGAAQAGIAELSANFAPSRIGIDFFVITFLSMAAIVCLPRQFYVTVIEARSSADITAARWPFVIYMLLTLLVVLPISAAGMALLPGDSRPDLFVLQLPLSHGWTGAALLIFLGGFSAATAMALVETIALSTMVSNDLIAPFLVRSRRFEGEGNLGRVLLTTRRAAIAGIMGAALAWALGMGDSQRLASIGLVAFAAMAQFAPALVMAVMGGNRDALAAKASLGAGLLVWIYTLALPQLASPAMLRWMEASAFNPHALFGIDGLSPISHGTIWSLGANIAVFALMTMRRVQPHAFPALLRMPGPSAAVVSNVGELKALAARFVGPEVTAETFAGVEESRPIDRAHRPPRRAPDRQRGGRALRPRLRQLRALRLQPHARGGGAHSRRHGAEPPVFQRPAGVDSGKYRPGGESCRPRPQSRRVEWPVTSKCSTIRPAWCG
jgi:Na+/proline symporter